MFHRQVKTLVKVSMEGFAYFVFLAGKQYVCIKVMMPVYDLKKTVCCEANKN